MEARRKAEEQNPPGNVFHSRLSACLLQLPRKNKQTMEELLLINTNLQDQKTSEWRAGVLGSYLGKIYNLLSPTWQNSKNMGATKTSGSHMHLCIQRHIEPTRTRGVWELHLWTKHRCTDNSLTKYSFLIFLTPTLACMTHHALGFLCILFSQILEMLFIFLDSFYYIPKLSYSSAESQIFS